MQVVALPRRGPLVARAEEPDRELGLRLGCGDRDVGGGDRRAWGEVPHGLAVGLDEVGVAAGGVVHRGQRVGLVRRVLVGRGRLERAVGGVAGEPVDALVAEEPLAVGLAGAEHRGQVREAGADHDDRQPRLAELVAGRAQRRDVVGAEVLHLVDEDADALADVGGEAAEVGEQLDEVDLDVAGVGPAAHGGRVDARAPLVLELRVRPGVAVGERLHHPEHVVDRLLVAVTELAHRLVQRAAQRTAQALAGAGLELAGAPALAHAGAAQRVEQHRLADPAQAGEHQAALGAAVGAPARGRRRRRRAARRDRRARAGAAPRRGRTGSGSGPRSDVSGNLALGPISADTPRVAGRAPAPAPAPPQPAWSGRSSRSTRSRAVS